MNYTLYKDNISKCKESLRLLNNDGYEEIYEELLNNLVSADVGSNVDDYDVKTSILESKNMDDATLNNTKVEYDKKSSMDSIRVSITAVYLLMTGIAIIDNLETLDEKIIEIVIKSIKFQLTNIDTKLGELY
jgi:hypothetical protein